MRYAVLDLGSNTFHLLIVSLDNSGGFVEIYRDRQYVKLAEEGIKKIGDAAYLRAIQTLKDFKLRLKEYQVENVRVFGTATIRSADNGVQFMNEVLDKLQLKIECISGLEEANLIALGVMEATKLNAETHLIMDIGGGSVEFIIINNNQKVWSRSFNIGISILKRSYHEVDPMNTESKEALKKFIKKTLTPLISALEDVGKVESLIGASGSFEVLIDVLGLTKKRPAYYETKTHQFKNFKEKIENLNYQERINHPHIPDPRADLIVVALILIDVTLEISGADKMIISEYALKEGALKLMTSG